MYRTIQDFIDDWKEESALTLQIFEAVDESKKAEKLNDNVRSLDRLAWHLTQTLSEMPFHAGLFAEDPLEHIPVPDAFKEIIATYNDYSNKVAELVTKNWTDKSLEEEVNMYGQQWKKSKVLSVLIRHQVHHRGQMTAIMRALGMPVPGIYGPAKEEWSRFGMPAMD